MKIAVIGASGNAERTARTGPPRHRPRHRRIPEKDAGAPTLRAAEGDVDGQAGLAQLVTAAPAAISSVRFSPAIRPADTAAGMEGGPLFPSWRRRRASKWPPSGW